MATTSVTLPPAWPITTGHNSFSIGGPQHSVILNDNYNNNYNTYNNFTTGLNNSNDNNTMSDEPAMFTETNPRLVNGVIVLLLLICNLLGNGLVFWVYHFRVKDTVFSFFVRVLAGLDLFNALTTMLMDVIIKVTPPTDPSPIDMVVLCKITHFQVYSNSLISGSVLMLIAYQRYRKICHPLQPSIKLKTAKIILLTCAVISIVLCSSCLVINGPKNIQILVRDHPVNTTICRYDKAYVGTLLQKGFSYTLIGAFFLVLLSTIIFYILVSRALKQFETNRASMIASPRSPYAPKGGPEFSALGRVEVDGNSRKSRSSNRKPSSPTEYELPVAQVYTPQQNDGQTAVPKRRPRPIVTRPSVFSLSAGTTDRASRQMYKMFLVITVVFIVSYLPHLIMLVITKSMGLDDRLLTVTQRFFMDLAYNAPYISTVANPLVYGFRSAEFRENCKQLLKCR